MEPVGQTQHLIININITQFKKIAESEIGKSVLHVPDTATRVLDNTRPFFLCSSIMSFWITLARSKEHKYFQAILVHQKCSSIHQYWDIPVSGT